MSTSAPTVMPATTPTPVETPRPTDGDGDHDRFSHYVRKDGLTASYVEGTPVIALCGKRWVPTRDPERFPVCPTCKEIMELIRSGGAGGGAGGDKG